MTVELDFLQFVFFLTHPKNAAKSKVIFVSDNSAKWLANFQLIIDHVFGHMTSVTSVNGPLKKPRWSPQA